MTKTTKDDHEFCAAYARLAKEGWCDSPGGMEYQRVREEWHKAGCPSQLDDFIVMMANIGSNGKGREVLN